MSDNFLPILSTRYSCYIEDDCRGIYYASNNRIILQEIYKIELVFFRGLSKRVEHNFVVLQFEKRNDNGLDLISKHGIIIDGGSKCSRILKLIIAKIKIGPIIDEKAESKFQLSHLAREVEYEFLKLFQKQYSIFAQTCFRIDLDLKQQELQ